ncbi:MAG: hypothetical protein NZM42_14070, partial [Gemmatales bacterium]|nr:hypothetical protein [Gemmatales bacterium]
LPLYASYTVDPDRRKKALMEAKANKRFDEIRAFEGTYKDGQLWAEYTVQTTDIINGMEVPRQSELRYRLEANSPVKSAFIRVVVTNATITADIQRAVRPELPPNTSVTDGRSDFSFRYLSKDGDWLELHELPLFATRLQDTSWEENAGAAIKTFTRAVVAGLVFIPVVLITYYFIRKRRLFPRQLTTTKHTTNILL